LYREGKVEQAIATLRRALKAHPRSVPIHHLLGSIYLARGSTRKHWSNSEQKPGWRQTELEVTSDWRVSIIRSISIRRRSAHWSEF
jgi:hypothetical protein